MSEENEEETAGSGTSRLIATIGQVPTEGGGRLEVTISAWTPSAKAGAPAPKEYPAALRVTRFTPSTGKKAVDGFRAKACSSFKTAAEVEGVATLMASAGPVLTKANVSESTPKALAESAPKVTKGKK